MQSVTPVVAPAANVQPGPVAPRGGTSFGPTPRPSDIVDVKMQQPPVPHASQPNVAAEPPVDPAVASFQAMQLWARSGSCTEVSDTSFVFQDRQPNLFAPGSLPKGM